MGLPCKNFIGRAQIVFKLYKFLLGRKIANFEKTRKMVTQQITWR